MEPYAAALQTEAPLRSEATAHDIDDHFTAPGTDSNPMNTNQDWLTVAEETYQERAARTKTSRAYLRDLLL